MHICIQLSCNYHVHKADLKFRFFCMAETTYIFNTPIVMKNKQVSFVYKLLYITIRIKV